MENKKFGQYGEKLAAKFLKRKGYKILQRNYFTKFGEIDIIARDGSELVFVEVKTRSDQLYGNPENAIDEQKLHHLQRMAQIYVLEKNLGNIPIRIDAVSVFIDLVMKEKVIEHFINISV